MADPILRRIAGAVASLFLAAGALAALPGPAHAEEGYQYWMYFHLEGDTWTFSDVGPADYQPEDGAVEGFRYGISTPSAGIEPRADLDQVNFDTICAGTEAGQGQKRVAVVVDYGTVEGNGTPPQPRAACAVAAEDASTQRVLAEVAEVRVEGGMTCALDGYPPRGCGEPVANADVPEEEQPVAFALPSGASQDAGTADATAGEAEGEAEGDAGGTAAGDGQGTAAGDGDGGALWPLAGIGLVAAAAAAGAFAMNRRRQRA